MIILDAGVLVVGGGEGGRMGWVGLGQGDRCGCGCGLGGKEVVMDVLE